VMNTVIRCLGVFYLIGIVLALGLTVWQFSLTIYERKTFADVFKMLLQVIASWGFIGYVLGMADMVNLGIQLCNQDETVKKR
jgi:hypothetical protein